MPVNDTFDLDCDYPRIGKAIRRRMETRPPAEFDAVMDACMCKAPHALIDEFEKTLEEMEQVKAQLMMMQTIAEASLNGKECDARQKLGVCPWDKNCGCDEGNIIAVGISQTDKTTDVVIGKTNLACRAWIDNKCVRLVRDGL